MKDFKYASQRTSPSALSIACRVPGMVFQPLNQAVCGKESCHLDTWESFSSCQTVPELGRSDRLKGLPGIAPVAIAVAVVGFQAEENKDKYIPASAHEDHAVHQYRKNKTSFVK